MSLSNNNWGDGKTPERETNTKLFQWMEDLGADLRYAIKFIGYHPGFAILAIATLALGIGANTAIFSVVNAVVFRPLPYKDSSHLVTLHGNNPKIGYDGLMPVCDSDYAQLKQQSRSFDGLAAFKLQTSDLTATGDPERVQGVAATASLFPLLGAHPQIGRTFSEEEQQPGRESVILLSRPLWERKFNSSPAVLGHTVVLDNKSFQVIGVMPADFQFPNQPDYWSPLVLNTTCTKAVNVIARLNSGTPVQQAQTEFDLVRQRLDAAHHRNTSSWRVRIVFLKDDAS